MKAMPKENDSQKRKLEAESSQAFKRPKGIPSEVKNCLIISSSLLKFVI